MTGWRRRRPVRPGHVGASAAGRAVSSRRRPALGVRATVACILAACATGAGQTTLSGAAPGPGEDALRVVILGTGTPNADPERSGPALAVIAGEQAYLVDAGPGIVRRAAAAQARHGIGALDAARLDMVFLTHLHSDHTLGLPDLIFTPWVLDRPGPLHVHGPPGTAAMAAAIELAWAEDVRARLDGLEPREANRDAYQSRVFETTGGLVHQDENVRITAIPVLHSPWPHAFGYKFESEGRTIVVSGDTRPSPALADACGGCDILVHEVYSARQFQSRPPEWQRYHAVVHTSTTELAEVAAQAQPRLLVLYHQLFWGASDEDLLTEVRDAGYEGAVVSAADLDVYVAGADLDGAPGQLYDFDAETSARVPSMPAWTALPGELCDLDSGG